MKDAKFMELLNLYLDQQIDPTDAALLEEEILRNPARRRVYLSYCRMHRACGVLFEKSLAADDQEALAAASAAIDRNLAAESEPRRWNPFVLASGMAALAACLAVFVSFRGEQDSGAGLLVAQPAVPVEESIVRNTMPFPQPVVLEPRDLQFSFNLDAARANLATMPLAPGLEWLTTMPQLTPVFPTMQTASRETTTGVSNGGVTVPAGQPTESTAFQIEK